MLERLLELYVKDIITDEQARVFGSLIESHIKQRTLEGRDKDNKPFKPYSNRPFALPAAAVPKYAIQKLKSQDQIRYFYRGKILFATILPGYSKYKMLIYSKTSYDGTPNLTLTGSMLRSFVVLSANNKQIRLGFNRPQASLVYYYNVLRGRDFLGLTAQELLQVWDLAKKRW